MSAVVVIVRTGSLSWFASDLVFSVFRSFSAFLHFLCFLLSFSAQNYSINHINDSRLKNMTLILARNQIFCCSLKLATKYLVLAKIKVIFFNLSSIGLSYHDVVTFYLAHMPYFRTL